MSRKRKDKTNNALLRNFANQVMTENKDGIFLFTPKGEISMSDAITQLIEPYSAGVSDYNSFSNLVTLACIAWNTSIFPENQRNEVLSKMVDVIPGKMEVRLKILDLLAKLMERKRKLFPNVSRVIIDHKVTDRGRGFHIAIASTLEKQDAEE